MVPLMDVPKCPRFLKGHGCPRSDVVCLSENDAKGEYYTFHCRTCNLPFAVSNPRGVAHAQFERELKRRRQIGGR
jgi:hypothetical protein